jgi:hypothetical protein
MDPSPIYKQFHTYVPLDQMMGLQWFALQPNYGTEYGPIHKSYRWIKTPKLLDIGNADIRAMIRDTIRTKDPMIVELSDPDEQYSGGASNKKYHLLVQQYFGDDYDGTIIDENHLHGNGEYSADDLAGPSEVVLWKNYDELLEENKSGGKTRKRRKTRKTQKSRRNKKTNKKQTKNKQKNKQKTHK